MRNAAQQNYRAGQQAIGAAIVSLVAAAYLFFLGHAEKADFYHLSGAVEFLKTELPGVTDRHQGKIRYLKLEGHERIFYLFVGYDTGDFSPAVNRVDELKPGDRIDVYYDDNKRTEDKQINQLTHFIEKDGQIYFDAGDRSAPIAVFLALAALGLLVWGIRLVKKHKNAR